MLIIFFAGMIITVMAAKLLQVLKKLDKELMLPEKLKRRELLLFFLAGSMAVQTESMVWLLMSVLFITYLLVIAYIDHYTGMVYSFFSYVVGMVGFVFMIFAVKPLQPALLAVGFAILVILIVGIALRAWAGGDTEILIACLPYLITFAAEQGEDIFLILLAFWMLMLVFNVIYAVCNGCHKRNAMSPAIAAAVCVIFAGGKWIV